MYRLMKTNPELIRDHIDSCDRERVLKLCQAYNGMPGKYLLMTDHPAVAVVVDVAVAVAVAVVVYVLANLSSETKLKIP